MTDEWRLDPLVARVVAWHNGHPLARRITPRQVRSLGFVALPFAVSLAADPAPAADAAAAARVRPVAGEDEASGSLRERALATARQPAVEPALASATPVLAPTPAPPPRRGSTMKAAFSEDFIAPLSPARVARWAAKFAREGACAPGEGPLRQVAVDDARVAFGHPVVMRYAMTAAVEAGGARTRVLIGPDPKAPVFGRRLPSAPRAAVAGAGVMAALSLVGGVVGPLTHEGPAFPGTAAARPEVAAAERPGPDPAPADAPSAPETPLDVEPRLGRVDLPPLLPALDASARDAARQARADRLPSPEAAGDRAGPAPPRPVANPVAVPPQAFWAVSSSLLRTRAESMQWLQALDALLREPGNKGLQVEALPEGDDWRVVGWPFARRADAERARALLLARGLKVQVVDF